MTHGCELRCNAGWFTFCPHGCRCGFFTDPRRECHCTPGQVQRYLSGISGPLLDRVDMQIDVPPVDYNDLRSLAPGEASAVMLGHVIQARSIQAQRFRRGRNRTNARMNSRQMKKHCALSADGADLLKRAMEQFALSARAYTKILKLARTVADLAEAEDIGIDHVAEAIQYRSLDRNLWA